jgi:hypothetical protein
LLRRYIPGPGTDQPIAMVTPAGASHTRSYFHVNCQGLTIVLASDAGVPLKYIGCRLDPQTVLRYDQAG